MTDVIQVTVAVNSEEDAHNIADVLITRRLAASVWASGPVSSTYWWKGKVEHATEWVCTIKTRKVFYDMIEQTIKELHPYEVPGILAHPVITGNQEYLNWLEQETQGNRSEAQGLDAQHTSKEQLIQELTDVHEQLIVTATEALQRGVKVGDWGPREILAHVAGWEAMAVARLPRVLAGVPPISYASEAQHTMMDDAINATIVTMIGEQPFDAICTILRKTYQADAQIISNLDESLIHPGSYVYTRTKAAIDHCHEHIQTLKP